jgi:hypothetical protein
VVCVMGPGVRMMVECVQSELAAVDGVIREELDVITGLESTGEIAAARDRDRMLAPLYRRRRRLVRELRDMQCRL